MPRPLFIKAALTVCVVVSISSGVRTQTANAKSAAVPRMPWGAPNLEGVYDFGSAVPMQRPAELAGKTTLTDADVAALEKQAEEQVADAKPDGDLTPPNYNRFWFEPGTRVYDRRTSLIVDPPDGRIPPLAHEEVRRAEAQRAAGGHPNREVFGGIGSRPGTNGAADGPEDRGLAERCITGFSSGPPITPSLYGNFLQVFQTPDHVVILTEMVHEARIVPLDGRPHLPEGVSQWLGDSRGRWDGDTLIIETTNFSPKRGIGLGGSHGTGETMHLIERLTRVDADTLVYEFTYDDPKVFTHSITASIPWKRKMQARVFEYACHEGNYGLEHILSGARAQERATSKVNVPSKR